MAPQRASVHDGFPQHSSNPGNGNSNGNSHGKPRVSVAQVTRKPTPTAQVGGVKTQTPIDHGHQQQSSAGGIQVGAPVQGSQASHPFAAATRSYSPFQTHASGAQGMLSTASHRPVLGTPLMNSRTASMASTISAGATSTGLFISSSAAFAASGHTASPSSSAASSNSGATQSSGVSSGAKVGIALAVIAGVALIAGLAFFFYRQRSARHEGHQRLDDEKFDGGLPKSSISSHVSVRRPKASAPRLSLRPVTEMFPGQETGGTGLMANSTSRARTPEGLRHMDMGNPFSDQTTSTNGPMSMNANAPSLAAVAAPAAVAFRGPSSGRTSPNSGTRSPGPGGLMGPPASNVHRVQLDFKPSMDDELELRAGEVVRLLHEYDDGWALCVRLDRSQQGVVPRTCLSKLPLKPRPGPPPGMRGPPRGPPSARMSPRHSPNGSSNSFGPMNPEQRRMSPPSNRGRSYSNAPYGRDGSTSPGPYGQQDSMRPRSNSSANAARRITPPSPLNPAATSREVPSRKPVPGQAM